MISIQQALAEGVSPQEQMNVAEWHRDRADEAARRRNHSGQADVTRHKTMAALLTKTSAKLARLLSA